MSADACLPFVQLYETIMPMVKQQVASQIKVRDFSNAKVSIAPAEYSSWQEARTDLMSESKRAMRAQLEAELGALESSDSDAIERIRGEFNSKERSLEHEIDHTTHTFACTLAVKYNFLSQ
jgi:hypothetical protein